MIVQAIDQLRGRLMRLKGKGSLTALAAEIGCDAITLQAFARGESVTQTTLTKIDQWCDTQEHEVRYG